MAELLAAEPLVLMATWAWSAREIARVKSDNVNFFMLIDFKFNKALNIVAANSLVNTLVFNYFVINNFVGTIF